MDSLPKQHIDSLPKGKREEAYEQVRWLFIARMNGVGSEEELSDGAGFPSVEAMRNRLEVWGFAGLLPFAGKPPQKTREPKAPQIEDESEELPRAANANPLFENTRRIIESEILVTANLKETLQGGRFISEAAGGAAKGTAGRGAYGGQWFPHPDLTRLIGSYLVEYGGDWGAVERLLGALHPKPAEANRKQLRKFIDGIDHDAKRPYRGDGLIERLCQVAALIRGVSEITPGRKARSISPHEQYDAWERQVQLEGDHQKEEFG